VPQVCRITLKQTYGADLDVVNRFFVKYSTAGPLSPAGATAWALAVAVAWGADLSTSLVPDLVLDQVILEDLSSSSGSIGVDSPAQPGSNTGPGMPAGVSMIIQEKIERRYRGGHPRQYLAGLPAAAASTEQTWSSGAIAALELAYATFRTAVLVAVPSGLAPAVDVNVSYYHGFTNFTFPSGRVRPIPTLRGSPLVDVITSFAVNPKLGSQRRRNGQSA